MCTAVDGVDAVGERERGLVEAIVVLERDLGDSALGLALHVEGVVMRYASLVEALDERLDAALEVVGDGAIGALVVEGDPDTLRQERHFSEALGEGGVVELGLGEDLAVRGEPDGGALLLDLGAVASGFELALGLAALVFLAVELALPANLYPHAFGERVDYGGADAVKTTRHLVGVAVELTAGVEVGHDSLEG